MRADRIKDFVEKYSVLYDDKSPDKVVKDAYNNFLREPLRKDARNAVQRLSGLEIKDQMTSIGTALSALATELTNNTPFDVMSVVVGNIQYPAEVADAVAKKMAATQVLERKVIEIKIEEKEAAKRIIQAGGIAKAMEIIQAKLTSQYLQHEAIEAQKAMVDSKNHTTIYIPVGPMGVPLVGTFDTTSGHPSKK